MGKLGHYAKNAAKAVITPINTFLAVSAISAIMSVGNLQAQNTNFKNTNTEITQTGYGNLDIQDENSQGIAGATITWTPVNVPGDSIPDPYTFTTDYEGVSSYEVLVFHDTSDGVDNNQDLELVQVRPNPSSDFTFNFIANKNPNNPIQVSDINGRVVGKYGLSDYNNHVAVYHVDLSDKANGVYFATTSIDGKARFSKLVKINDHYVGNLGSLAKPKNNFKTSQEFEAIYDVSITADGYYPLTDQRTVIEGDNGNDFYALTSIDTSINNLDLEGYVWELENINTPLENAQVRVTVNSTGDEYNVSSDSTGYFRVDSLPLGEDITFDVGGISGRYSFTGINFTTPSEIVNPEDSVNSNFSAVLPLKLATSSAQHIRDQSINGTNQDTIWYYLGPTFNPTQKNNIRNYFTNLQVSENNVYIFAESNTMLNDKGINIEYGTYNTNTQETEIQTPLGTILHPVIYANTTMGTGDYPGFVHEIKRALAYDGVAWTVPSVMEATAPAYTQEDKDIARFVERPYWNAVYQDEKTWINLNKIAEDMNSKSLNGGMHGWRFEGYHH